MASFSTAGGEDDDDANGSAGMKRGIAPFQVPDDMQLTVLLFPDGTHMEYAPKVTNETSYEVRKLIFDAFARKAEGKSQLLTPVTTEYDSENDIFIPSPNATTFIGFSMFLFFKEIIRPAKSPRKTRWDDVDLTDSEAGREIMFEILKRFELSSLTYFERKESIIFDRLEEYSYEEDDKLFVLRKTNYTEHRKRLVEKSKSTKNIVLIIQTHGSMEMEQGSKKKPFDELRKIAFENEVRTLNHIHVVPEASTSYSSQDLKIRVIDLMNTWDWKTGWVENATTRLECLRKLMDTIVLSYRSSIREWEKKGFYKEFLKNPKSKQFIYDSVDKMGRMSITRGVRGGEISDKIFYIQRESTIEKESTKLFYLDEESGTMKRYFGFYISNSAIHIRHLYQLSLGSLIDHFYNLGFLNVILIDASCNTIRDTNARDIRGFRRSFLKRQNNISDEEYNLLLYTGDHPAAAVATASASATTEEKKKPSKKRGRIFGGRRIARKGNSSFRGHQQTRRMDIR